MNFKQNMVTLLDNMSTTDFKWIYYDLQFKYDIDSIIQLSQPGILRDSIQ